MLPLHDDNPTRTTPVLTYLLIAINVVVFLLQLVVGDVATFRFGLIPFVVTGAEPVVTRATRDFVELAQTYHYDPAWVTIFTSMFMHGSWLHLIFNMVFLAIFGNNIEDALGKIRFLLFYLACGAAAAGAQIALQPGSVIPMVGASGAIAGVLGGYFLLYPRARVTCLTLFLLLTVLELPASLVLGFWFLSQVFMGIFGWGEVQGGGGGVAYAAHIGGFIAGYLLIRLFGGRPEPPRPRYYPRPDFIQMR